MDAMRRKKDLDHCRLIYISSRIIIFFYSLLLLWLYSVFTVAALTLPNSKALFIYYAAVLKVTMSVQIFNADSIGLRYL